MVKFTIIGKEYKMKIHNSLTSDLHYDVTGIDATIPPGKVAPSSEIELVIQPPQIPIINPCVQLLVLPYNYNRPAFVEFSTDEIPTIQNIDLTEMPGFSMVENDDSIDHIMEAGYNVKLYGSDTSNIRLDVFFMV